MPANAVPSLLQHARRLAEPAPSDEELLADFLARRGDEAFAALLRRHGPMVLNTCRRILHDPHAAEDVFQATFLVLAGRAGSIRRRASLAGFLHGVASRLAVRARRRKQMRELPAAVPDAAAGPPDVVSWQEVLGILDQELGRMSERYRAPLVLCYLEGRTQDEAARQLGWSLNTLRRRVSRGRQLLEARLRGRGVSLPAALAGVLTAGTIAIPARLSAATLATVGARAVSGLSAAPFALVKFVAPVVAAGVVAVCVAFGWNSPVPQPAATPPQTPLAADPLPPQGAVRLGTANYRYGTRIDTMAVSADGRFAAVRSSHWHSSAPAQVFDLTTGRSLYALPHDLDHGTEAVGFSPDGKTLVTKDSTHVTFRDPATGKALRSVKYLPSSGGSRSVTDWLTFTPDGKYLAVTMMGDAIQLIDVGTGELVRAFEHVIPVAGCTFSPDGKWMATRGYDDTQKVNLAQLWEVATGKALRRFAVNSDLHHSISTLAFSPDGATLATSSWRDARLRLWDAATGKELTAFPKIGDDVVSIVFAPDGKTVAAAGDRVHLYDPATGKERLRIDRRARGLAFSRDGSVLTGAVSGAIYRWDAASGRQLTPTPGQDSGVEQILITPDGRKLFTIDQDGDLHAWDTTGETPPRRVVGDVGRGAVMRADGRYLGWAVKGQYGGSRVRLYDIATERFLDHFAITTDEENVEGFLPDGKTVVTVDRCAAAVRFWDIESGKQLRAFAAHSDVDSRGQMVMGYPYANRRVALSPDGTTLLIGVLDRGFPVGVWDVATGKAGHTFDVKLTSVNEAADKASRIDRLGHGGRGRINGHMSSGVGVAYSADGRLVATWSENPFGKSDTDHATVWDAATGRAVAKLATDRPIGAACAAFAPDGRTLATASAGGFVRVWEVGTWKVRAEFRGHRDRITAMAFGPDGRLYTGGLDTVVMGWDARPPREPAKGTLAEAWDALASPDARAGFAAQGRFLAEPDKAVEWFATRVTPVNVPDAAHLTALIADLDNDDFAARERATATLKDHGPLAVAALREAAAKSPSAETRRRATVILGELANGLPSPCELRALRAVEVLEWAATKDARARLGELAKGTPDARVTRDAAAASRRLNGR